VTFLYLITKNFVYYTYIRTQLYIDCMCNTENSLL